MGGHGPNICTCQAPSVFMFFLLFIHLGTSVLSYCICFTDEERRLREVKEPLHRSLLSEWWSWD